MSETVFWLVTDDGQRTKLEHGISSVGRDASNDIVISGGSISRNHAEIRVDGEFLLIRDVGSSNGTFINGKRVRSGELEDGDSLAFGDVKFSVSREEDKPEGEDGDGARAKDFCASRTSRARPGRRPRSGCWRGCAQPTRAPPKMGAFPSFRLAGKLARPSSRTVMTSSALYRRRVLRILSSEWESR